MSWKHWIGKFRGGQVERQVVPRRSGDEPAVATTPIRGFKVLGLAYPNHLHPELEPMTAYDIALRLSHDMDVEWFYTDQALKKYACTGPVRGNEDNDDAFGFDFGPYDFEAEDFTVRYTVIVRETAGGGFMLLIQESAQPFADQMRTLFDGIVADPERKNPDVDRDEDEPPKR